MKYRNIAETENVLLPLWLFRDLVAVDFLANSIETSSKWTVFTDSFRFYRHANINKTVFHNIKPKLSEMIYA